MKFFSKETSQRLKDIGCVTHSGHGYGEFSSNNSTPVNFLDDILAVTIADFLGDEEYCFENLKKIILTSFIGQKLNTKEWTDMFVDQLRIHILKQKDQEAFIREAIGLKAPLDESQESDKPAR